mmetsp:Transcript_3051/g.4293  ORF Transcript_3051/g.4293 Transcript_3051/m.4293 type:complete len:684 (-) Transcript_3051:176-2227(-)|eukprot:CAMPEP_0184865570 /NCGR_PEP_ID=MMETSP0580-20130426/18520_1 /TAXON_ID=1118495 /ORGANISM="Dactyliosolen fragilissimus" /LENGTH=683 /DNA_ID=CAMNT_0027364835 /DNA_START=159 /DNA_END=2210 /DNA_ORIENTATION=+
MNSKLGDVAKRVLLLSTMMLLICNHVMITARLEDKRASSMRSMGKFFGLLDGVDTSQASGIEEDQYEPKYWFRRQQSGPFHVTRLRNLIRSRCDGHVGVNEKRTQQGMSDKNLLDRRISQGSALWAYEGALVDPRDGKVIANVEGLEIVRHLSECYNDVPDTQNGYDLDKDGTDEQKKTRLWQKYRGMKRLGDLAVSRMLHPVQSSSDRTSLARDIATSADSEISMWDYAATILSRKIFCYRSPDNPHQLLHSIRLHPTGPSKNIPIDQATAIFDTATTYISRNNGNEMVIHTEWPDGRWITSRAEPPNASSTRTTTNQQHTVANSIPSPNTESQTETFDFNTYAQSNGVNSHDSPQLPPNNLRKTGHATTNVLDKIETSDLKSNSKSASASASSSSSTITVSPPRSKFIQFGQDPAAESRKYGGARETYSYTMTIPNSAILKRKTPFQNILSSISNTFKNSFLYPIQVAMEDSGLADFSTASSNQNPCLVKYTRYGEAPPWYGPGRMCTLELTGKRVMSLSDLPPLVTGLVAEHIPGWMTVHTPIPNGENGEYNHEDDATTNAGGIRSRNGGSKGIFGTFFKQKNKSITPLTSMEKDSSFLDTNIIASQMKADGKAIQAVDWFRAEGEESGKYITPQFLENDKQIDLSTHGKIKNKLDSISKHFINIATKLKDASTISNPFT